MSLPKELLENVISVLVKRLDGHVVLSKEEIEDAPDIEIRDLFETDEVEMRVSTWDKDQVLKRPSSILPL